MLTPPASPAALDRTIEDADNAIADARRQLGEHDFWHLRDAAEAMAQEAGFSVEDGRALQCLLRWVARARLQVAEAHRGRLEGRDVWPGDPSFPRIMPTPKTPRAAPGGVAEGLG